MAIDCNNEPQNINSKENIKDIYTYFVSPLCKSLQRWIPTSRFQKIFCELKQKGWKDWQVLLALLKFSLEYQLEKTGIRDPLIRSKFIEYFLNHEEQEKYHNIPIRLLTIEALEHSLYCQIDQSFGECQGFLISRISQIELYLDFLSRNAMYWDEDVEHQNIFTH